MNIDEQAQAARDTVNKFRIPKPSLLRRIGDIALGTAIITALHLSSMRGRQALIEHLEPTITASRALALFEFLLEERALDESVPDNCLHWSCGLDDHQHWAPIQFDFAAAEFINERGNGVFDTIMGKAIDDTPGAVERIMGGAAGKPAPQADPFANMDVQFKEFGSMEELLGYMGVTGQPTPSVIGLDEDDDPGPTDGAAYDLLDLDDGGQSWGGMDAPTLADHDKD